MLWDDLLVGTDEWLVVTQIQSVKSSNSSDTIDLYMFFAHFSPPAFCPCLYNTGKSIIYIFVFPKGVQAFAKEDLMVKV